MHFEQFEIGLRGLRFRKDDFTGMGIPSGSVIVSRAPSLLGLVIVPFGFMVMAVVIAVFRFGRMSVPDAPALEGRFPQPVIRATDSMLANNILFIAWIFCLNHVNTLPRLQTKESSFRRAETKNYAMKTGGARSSGNAAASGRATGSANGAKETVATA